MKLVLLILRKYKIPSKMVINQMRKSVQTITISKIREVMTKTKKLLKMEEIKSLIKRRKNNLMSRSQARDKRLSDSFFS